MKLFEDLLPVPGEQKTIRPKGYTGLHAFHKYWGKKPLEVLAFLIEQLTRPQDLVIDPFTGSGTAGVAPPSQPGGGAPYLIDVAHTLGTRRASLTCYLKGAPTSV
jgi:hypothetical protein